MEQVSVYYSDLLEVVAGGAAVLATLETTEKSGGGIEMEVVLEAVLDTTEKSAGGMEIDVVAEVAGVLSFEVEVVDVMLLL